MTDRRDNDDRRDGQRGAERRLGDRRDSHRLPIDVEVKVGNDPFRTHRGNVGIGGVFFDEPLMLPTGAKIVIRILIPETNKNLEVQAEVVEVSKVGHPGDVGTRVRFTDLDIRSELLLARYLDKNPV